MNRRQKIIVSVTGIFIVLLILIGLTYGYFLTRITGNSNPTSISVTTANLELVYGDGTTSILTNSNPIEPGKFTSSKDFTVTNNGNALTDYAVTIEDFSIVYANDTVIDGASVKAGTVTKMEYPSDMQMTITCVIESDDKDRNGQVCGSIDSTLPTENSILLTNSIEVDDIHKYVLTLTYVDSGIDQSADMNKTIKGKIDIIDPKSTIDLTGTVATYQIGDYVEINSTPIRSEIVDGQYKIIGVEPGSHTLNIKYKDANGNVQTRGSQSLTIKKGESASVSGNIIIFTETLRNAKVDVSTSYDITIEDIKKTNNPFSENTSTLAYHIINNSMLNKNGTEFVDTPPTKVGIEKSKTIVTDKVDLTKLNPVAYFWDVYLDENTNEIYDSVYSGCTNDLIGKYIEVYMYGDKRYLVEGCDGLNPIVTKNIEEYEQVLSYTDDDYGRSYYFRGNIEDNYVNFAGMCWRIVRIEGDGSVKLILEDQNGLCEESTGNWQIGSGNFGVGSAKDYLSGSTSGNNYMANAFKNYQTTIAKKIDNSITDNSNVLDINRVLDSKMKRGNWCYGNKLYTSTSVDLSTAIPLSLSKREENFSEYIALYSSSYIRLDKNKKVPTLKCDGTLLTDFNDSENPIPMYVGTLTLDEVLYAGDSMSGNQYFYLINEYQINKGFGWFTLTHRGNIEYYTPKDTIYTIPANYEFTEIGLPIEDEYLSDYSQIIFRPAISLLSNTLIAEGDGTKSNPYVVE